MNAIDNISAVARHAICATLSALVVSTGLLVGSVQADAEFASMQRAQVTVEVVRS